METTAEKEVEYGGYLVMIGGVIVSASEAALPDTTYGSPRQVGVALGALFLAIGGFLVARGHKPIPGTVPA